MKIKTRLAFLFAWFLLISIVSISAAQDNQPVPSPAAFFPEPIYVFPVVVEGVKVKHDFKVQNKGSADLEIRTVRTGWGCTAVSYEKQIPPGGEGKISIEVNTGGYGGRGLKHEITIQSNDPIAPRSVLTIQGNVERFVSIIPSRVHLAGASDQLLKMVVSIVPEEKYPFNIVGTRMAEGKNIQCSLETVKQSFKTVYMLTIENIKKNKGNYYDRIFLDTDSKIRPVITISVSGRISE